MNNNCCHPSWRGSHYDLLFIHSQIRIKEVTPVLGLLTCCSLLAYGVDVKGSSQHFAHTDIKWVQPTSGLHHYVERERVVNGVWLATSADFLLLLLLLPSTSSCSFCNAEWVTTWQLESQLLLFYFIFLSQTLSFSYKLDFFFAQTILILMCRIRKEHAHTSCTASHS